MFEMIVRNGVAFACVILMFLIGVTFAVAVIIRVVSLVRSTYCKDSTSDFRTLLMFRKWFATALDLLSILLIVFIC